MKPILFLIYVGDLSSNIPCQDLCKFAGDTTFINKGSNSEALSDKTKSTLEMVNVGTTQTNF